MYKSKDGFVLTRRSNHMEDHLDALPFLHEAIGKVDFSGFSDIVIGEVDMGRIVGDCICVCTGPEDQIIWIRRPYRNGKTRFVLNREPEPSQFVTFIASKRTKTLVTAYIGKKSPREPWDRFDSEQERYESIAFWENHALAVSPRAALADR